MRALLPVSIAILASSSSQFLLQQAAPPAPLEPLPSPRQLAWQAMEMNAFVHFGMNTFTDREWGDGKEDPALFAPSDLDCKQWASTFRDAGFHGVILTCKHHDGFCLWPSKFTDHSVKRSPWRGGKGDVVKELSDACRECGLKFGVYLSPWDRHEPSYGDSPRYNQHYKDQLRELLTSYGEIFEVWFDGACGEGPNGKRQEYDWPGFVAVVRELQPNAVIFSDAGPDVRWVGNESGFANPTNWCLLNRDKFSPGHADENELGTGHADGKWWVPSEVDVSIRPGWFNHTSEDAKVKSLDALLGIWTSSVGRNSVLLLNVPPDRRGRIADGDAARLLELRRALDAWRTFDLARGARATATDVRASAAEFAAEKAVDGDADSYWATDDGVTSATLELDLGRPIPINRALLVEHVALGQRVQQFRVEAEVGGSWKSVGEGTTIGFRRVVDLEPVRAARVRLVILAARACPTLATFSLFHLPQPAPARR